MSKFKPADFDQRPVVPCAHDLCPHSAILSRKVNGAMVNLCKAHDLFHVQQEADEFCRHNGLTTRAKQVAFIKARRSRIGREPGQDDEEIPA